jgi:SAM-dependent methyltransferase
MKIRESGMPPQDTWDTFFNAAAILDALQLDASRRDVVEFGCGYGSFALPAAERISGTVHALDLDPTMLAVATRNALSANISNIEFLLRDFVADGTGLPDQSVDYAMLFNILHLEHPVALLREAYRNLAEGGLLGIIHWVHDDKTPRGPPLDIRPKPEQCLAWAVEAGFEPASEIFDMRPYHYGLVMRR